MSNEQRDSERKPEESPAAWFVVLERAKRANNFELAAQAQRELNRLGVKVSYKPVCPYKVVDRE